MTQQEIDTLRAQLDEIEEESRKRLYRQMDLLASDVKMDDAQREAFYGKIREELSYMRRDPQGKAAADQCCHR